MFFRGVEITIAFREQLLGDLHVTKSVFMPHSPNRIRPSAVCRAVLAATTVTMLTSCGLNKGNEIATKSVDTFTFITSDDAASIQSYNLNSQALITN